MTVTEIAVLKALPPYTWGSAETQSLLAAAATQQAAWSGYSLHYFQDTTDEAIVYILTGWESVPAHWKWIKSEPNQRLLELGKGLMELVELKHAHFVADLQGVQLVALEQWEGERGELKHEDGEMVDVAGKVEENPEQACRLRGFAEERKGSSLRGEGLGDNTVLLRKLPIASVVI